MSTAIKFEQVSKKFIQHHQRSRSFQELVLNLIKGQGIGQQEDYWSLRGVNFEIPSGETVGLIGPNGAGKSTILKLITRIIRPTSGQIQINGRVGALLELGSGFHPDMTGRENIYLNGSILGLSQAEIRGKLDEIIAFAELDRFIDLPVKHYSSGMYVRLGFAVAVHTEPDILLVDEVLAVGDAAFQRKCIERIDYLRQQGLTIVLVSHSLEAVQRICRRAIWVDSGQVMAEGDAEAVTQKYAWHSYETNPVVVSSERRWGSGEITIEQVRLLDRQGQEQHTFRTNDMLTVQFHYQVNQRVERPVFGLAIHRSDGVHVTGPNTRFNHYDIPLLEDAGVIEYNLSHLSLLEGTYFISVAVSGWDLDATHLFDYHDQLYPFRVYTDESGERFGLMAANGQWQLKPVSKTEKIITASV